MQYTEIFLSSAMEMRGMGFSIIPLEEATKNPSLHLLPKDDKGMAKWETFSISRPSWEQMRKWASQCPNANYGVVCGYSSRIRPRNGPSGYLYVVDVDHKDHFERMREEFTVRGLSCPIVASGRGGHFYLLSTAPFATQDIYWNGMKLEIKGQGSYVVGPNCIHPDTGTAYESNAFDSQQEVEVPLVDDPWFADEDLIIADLLSFSSTQLTPFTVLLNRAKHYHRNKDGKPVVKPSYSEALQATAECAWNRDQLNPEERWELFCRVMRYIMTQTQIPNHLSKRHHRGGDALVDRALKRAWDKVRREDSAQSQRWLIWVDHVISVVARGSFLSTSCRKNPVDRMVLLAHLERSRKRRNSIYHLDHRSGCMKALCSRVTFSRSSKRLEKDYGYIERVRQGSNRGNTSCYKINTKAIEEMLSNSGVAEETGDSMGAVQNSDQFLVSAPSPRSGLKMCGDGALTRNLKESLDVSGAFERGGLGATGQKVYLRLLADSEMSATDLAAVLCMNKKTLDTNLAKLVRWGVVKRMRPGIYVATSPEEVDFDDIATELGTADKPQKRKLRCTMERRQDRHRRAEYRYWEGKKVEGTKETGVTKQYQSSLHEEA